MARQRLSICLLGAALLFAGFVPAVAGDSLLDLFGMMGSPPDKKAPKYRLVTVDGDEDCANLVLLIRVSGMISQSEAEDFPAAEFGFRQDLVERIRKDVKVAIDDKRIKAVIIDLDSPGGEITASDIVHHELAKIAKSKKPVFALIGSLGASGGYYVACAARKIWAHPTSIVGSIGVLIQSANLEQLAEKIGFRNVTMKSQNTPKKDVLSPFRSMTDEEKAMIQKLIEDMYDQFLEVVATARGKTKQELLPIADGGIYSAFQAKALGLIDGIGYRDDVVTEIKTELKLQDVRLVRRRDKASFNDILSIFTASDARLSAAMMSSLAGLLGPRFRTGLYLLPSWY